MKKNDLLTIIAISALSWILVNIIHEFFGHAVFGMLAGLKLNAVSTTTAYLNVNWDDPISLSFLQLGGVVMNFVTGLIAFLFLKFKKPANSQISLFLWLFTSFSYIIIVMNLISVTIIGGGDIPGLINTFNNPKAAKIIVLIIGFTIMITGYIFIQKSFIPKMKGHRTILISITFIPVLTMIVVQTLSLLKSPFAWLPPAQNHLLASVFAYFHFILWALVVNIVPCSNKSNSIENVFTAKSIYWITIGIIILLFYIFILGPGIGSFEGHPSLKS
jgi:hypothetical protein